MPTRLICSMSAVTHRRIERMTVRRSANDDLAQPFCARAAARTLASIDEAVSAGTVTMCWLVDGSKQVM